MPKENYTSITIKKESYDKLHSDYDLKKHDLQIQGISSFSGYIQSLSEKKTTSKLDDLREIMCINTQILFTMFDFMSGTDRDTCIQNNLRAKQHMFEYLKNFQQEADS